MLAEFFCPECWGRLGVWWQRYGSVVIAGIFLLLVLKIGLSVRGGGCDCCERR